MVNRIYLAYSFANRTGADVEFIESIEETPFGIFEIHFWILDYAELAFIEFYYWEDVENWIISQQVEWYRCAQAAPAA